jgi:superfamily I DNA and/or RNA helicase
MDETTQAVEPSALIPLVHHAMKMVLVGDQKQLGTTVDNPRLKSLRYNRTLFERLIKQGIPSVMLDVQFRTQGSDIFALSDSIEGNYGMESQSKPGPHQLLSVSQCQMCRCQCVT